MEKDRFSLEEWHTLQFAPLWTFKAVAMADGYISPNEVKGLDMMLSNASATDDPLQREILVSLTDEAVETSKIWNADPRDPGAGIKDTLEILQIKATPNELYQFKLKLFHIAAITAIYASGDKDESVRAISKKSKEKAVLALLEKLQLPEDDPFVESWKQIMFESPPK